MQDEEIIRTIEEIQTTRNALNSRENLSEQEVRSINAMKVKLDQYNDLLAQRTALRDAGKNPEEAKMRPPDLV
jgi:hypothetical protein